jgi:hypothetical protein
MKIPVVWASIVVTVACAQISKADDKLPCLGVWSIEGQLVEGDTPYFNEKVTDKWLIVSKEGKIFAENPTNHISLPVTCNVEGTQCSIGRKNEPWKSGFKSYLISEEMSLNFEGDKLQGTSVNTVQRLKKGKPVNTLIGRYKISGNKLAVY